MFRSIRSKLVSISIASLFACASLVFYFSLNEHRNLYRASVESNLDALSANMADNLLLAMASDYDEFSLSAELLQFERYPHIKYAIVYNRQWEIINQYIRTEDLKHDETTKYPNITNIKRLSFDTAVVNNHLVNLSPIGEAQYPVGFILVVQDFISPLEESRKNFFSSVSPFVLLTITASILAVWWLYQQYLNPLIKLSQFTRLVEKTKNYQLHYDVEGDDEVAELGGSINQLLRTIDAENKVNEKQKRKLVEQRESLRRMAEYDLLTKLPNRTSFMRNLQKALSKCRENDEDLAVLFFDVDGFKSVNDSFGHDAGDELLIAVSKCVKSCLRESDILARLGGDEFLVMMPHLKTNNLPKAAAKRILDKFKDPLHICNFDIQSCVSIGIAYAKETEYDKVQLIANADLAMYHSKENGKGLYTEFAAAMLDSSRRKLNIANLMSKALKQDEFSVYYQLKISAQGKVDGAEALLRWTDSEYGFISPSEFIPIAEKSGNIQMITQWVIKQVFKDLPSLVELCGPAIVVSLNISSHDLEDPNLINTIRGAIFEHGTDIRKIQFELTESSYLNNFEKSNRFINEINEIGASIALDDFGTGYSSLSYLTKINIDTLKIDRSFVQQMQESTRDTAILETILDLSHRLNLKTCSEGIENAQQACYLIDHGCQQLQGFLFSRPRPLSKINKAYIAEVESIFSTIVDEKHSSIANKQ